MASAVIRTTSTTAMSVATPRTRSKATQLIRSKPSAPPPSPVTLSTVSLSDTKTPAASSIDHTTATATIVMIPNAMASMKDTFMIVHGSTRVSLRCARRTRCTGLPGLR